MAEYLAYGLPVTTPAEGLGRLAETISIVRRMYAEDAFDFCGRYYSLTGTLNEPKPARPSGRQHRTTSPGGWPANSSGRSARGADRMAAW